MAPLVEQFGLSHVTLVERLFRAYGLGAGIERRDNKHVLRREDVAQRRRLYRDEADTDYRHLINSIFEDSKVREDRIRLIPVAKHQNVARRFVDELASLYNRPAVRRLGDEAATVAYSELAKERGLHDVMRDSLRMLFLCNNALVWNTETRMSVVTPDLFDAIPSPTNSGIMAGVVIHRAPVAIDLARDVLPVYEIWDDEFTYYVNAQGRIVDRMGNAAEPVAHGLGRIPGVLLHRQAPTGSELIDSASGRDITSGHLATFLLNIMTMRLGKAQGEQVPVLTGDMAHVVQGQRLDGENPIALPPGVIASVLNTKTSPEHYIAMKREIIAALEQTYGLPPSDSVAESSGFSISARRMKLTEIREESRLRAIVHESEICKLLGFDASSLRVDFREQAIPVDASEELALLRDGMKLGVDSPVAHLQRKNPDLSRDEAVALLGENIADYAMLVTMVRALNAPAPGDGGVDNVGHDPQANGTNNDGSPSALKPGRVGQSAEQNGTATVNAGSNNA